MKNKVNYLAIVVFFVIAVALRYLTNKTAILDGVHNDFLKAVLQGAGPAVGAFTVFALFGIKMQLTLQGNYRKLTFPFLLFWVLSIALILTAEYYIKGTLSGYAVFTILVYGLLEEIGWRGFLQRELKPLPEFVNILLVATLWFLWHLNLEFTSSNLMFFGILVLGSWGIGKVADATNSLLAVAAFHSLNNFFGKLTTINMIIIAVLLIVWITSLLLKKKYVHKSAQDAAI